MEDKSLQLDKEVLVEKDGITSSYTDMNRIGLFTESFRANINLHNGIKEKEEAIVNGMMFTHANEITGYDNASNLMFLNKQELVIHREPIVTGRTTISVFDVIGMLMILILSFIITLIMLRKNKMIRNNI